jgi:hypothetical protein
MEAQGGAGFGGSHAGKGSIRRRKGAVVRWKPLISGNLPRGKAVSSARPGIPAAYPSPEGTSASGNSEVIPQAAALREARQEIAEKLIEEKRRKALGEYADKRDRCQWSRPTSKARVARGREQDVSQHLESGRPGRRLSVAAGCCSSHAPTCRRPDPVAQRIVSITTKVAEQYLREPCTRR